MGNVIKGAKDLIVYQKAYKLAMEIFKITKSWTVEEKYSLIDQIRRSSRSVSSNISEAWAKRKYKAHYVNKLTNADAKNSETLTWLDFSLSCGYIKKSVHNKLQNLCQENGKMLGSMILNPEIFLLKPKSNTRKVL
ncbi:MAG: four helix bundle protein [bacterium]